MSDLFTQGGIGGVGAFFGAFLSWLGFKQRLDAQDKRINTLADNVVYEDTFKAEIKGFNKQLDTFGILMAEMRKDIKTLIRKEF